MTVEVVLHLPGHAEPVILELDPATVPRVGEEVAWIPDDADYWPVVGVGWGLDHYGVQVVHVTVERKG